MWTNGVCGMHATRCIATRDCRICAWAIINESMKAATSTLNKACCMHWAFSCNLVSLCFYFAAYCQPCTFGCTDSLAAACWDGLGSLSATCGVGRASSL